jgi:flagellar basal-body rod protein FlgB
MSNEIINDPVMSLLAKSLSGYSTRNSAIANNIANANTPGFKRGYVTFESQLAEIVGQNGLDGSTKQQEEIEAFQPTSQVDTLTASRSDGNNVNIDQEMAELARNGLSYNAAATALKAKISMYTYVITEGRH